MSADMCVWGGGGETGLTATTWYAVSRKAFKLAFGMGHLYAAVHRPICSQLRCILTVISGFFSSELRAVQVLRPIEPEVAASVQVNWFSLVPKGHQPGKWQLIVDLSFPQWCSVNDGIEPEVCSLHYTSVDEVCKRVVAKGCGMVLVKFDVEDAFCTIPVHPNDRKLLGMHWEGRIYVDMVLLFGLRSAPKLYNAVADVLLWIPTKPDDVETLHCIDDFLVFEPQISSNVERPCGEHWPGVHAWMGLYPLGRQKVPARG